MLQSWRLRSIAVLVVTAAFCLPARLDAAQGGTARPFKGSASGAVSGSIPPNVLLVGATGNATHLGNFTRQEVLVLGADGSFTGTIVFVAANGDELHVDVSGGFTGATTAAGTYTFTGGTGRFDDATGSATFEVDAPDFGHVSVTFDGTINY
jgi:hypothetical protein